MTALPIAPAAGTHLVVGAGEVGSAVALVLADAGADVVLASRSGRGTRRRPHHPRARSTRPASTPCSPSRPTAAVIYNCVNPEYTELDDGLAAHGEGLPRLRRAHGRRARHRVEPLRLRPRRRADDRGSAAGGGGGEGPRARADVAGRQGGERRRPHPGHRGARLGLHLPRCAEHARRPRHAADPGGQERAADRRHRPAALLDRARSTSRGRSSPPPPTSGAGAAPGTCRATRRARSARRWPTWPPRPACRR